MPPENPPYDLNRLAIFVDTRNLVGITKKIFPNTDYSKQNLLPPNANWELFFNSLCLHEMLNITDVKIYWYFVKEFEFDVDTSRFTAPYSKEQEQILKNRKVILSKHSAYKKKIRKHLPDVVIREAGWQKCYLNNDYPKLGTEKAVDTAIAVDMIDLHDTFDTCLVFSGDGDFVPVLRRLRTKGKESAGFFFYTENGKLLKNCAMRLQKEIRFKIDVPYRQMRTFMRP